MSEMRTTKSAGNSRKCRVEGNALFCKGCFKSALEHYNEALLAAPFESDEFYLAISNRIAANLELGNLEACLRDGHRMFQNSNSRQDLRTKTEQRIKKANDLLDKEPSRRNANRQKQIVELYKGPNKVAASLSQAVTIRYDKQKGRHIVATQDIPPGSVVLLEEPYASVLYPQCACTHCHFCHVELPADPLPCKVCSEKVWFCSEMCRDKCWNEYHRFECGWERGPLWTTISQEFLMAFRMLVITNPTMLIELEPGRKKTLEDSWAQFGANGETYSFSYDTVARLESHHENTGPEDLKKYKDVATALTKLLTLKQYFEANWPEGYDETRKITVAKNNLVRLIEQCKCNSFGMKKLTDTLEKLKSVEQAKEDCIENIVKTGNISGCSVWDLTKLARGLYPTGSLFNHSCVMNCASSFFNGRTLIMRTVTELKKGDELKFCYGSGFGDATRDERQRHLEKHYFFKCDCSEACNNKEAEAIEQETIGMACPKCKIGPAFKLVEGQPGYVRRTPKAGFVDVKCVNCGAVSHMDNTAIQMSISMKLLMLKRGGGPNAHSAKELLKDLRRLSEKLHPMHKELVHFRESIGKYCFEAGCYEESHALTMENIKCTDRLYGPNSIRAAADIEQCIGLLKVLKGKQKKFIPELKEYCKRVAGIYAVYFGPDFPLVKEVEGFLEEC